MTTIVTRNGMRVIKRVTCLRCGYQDCVCHCHWSDLPMAIEDEQQRDVVRIMEEVGIDPEIVDRHRPRP